MNKIIHRDIKPQNILIHKNEYILADLGISRMNFNSSTVVGTSYYIAPEIVKGEIHTFQVDMFSLGVLFYKILYNCFPLPDFKKFKDFNKEYEIDFSLRSDISNDCKDLIWLMLIFEPTLRINFINIYNHPLIINYLKESGDLISDINSIQIYSGFFQLCYFKKNDYVYLLKKKIIFKNNNILGCFKGIFGFFKG